MDLQAQWETKDGSWIVTGLDYSLRIHDCFEN